MCCLFIGKGRVIFNSLQVYENIPICINNAADHLSRYHAHPRILCDGSIVQRLTFCVGAKPITAGDHVDTLSRFYPPCLRKWVNWIG